MEDDIWDAHLEWLIDLARRGDGELLAELLRGNEPIPPKLREFLAGVVAGKIKLKPPLLRTRTFAEMSRRWLREKHAALAVEMEMRDRAKSRDLDLRTALIQKWSKCYGTDEAAVRRYL